MDTGVIDQRDFEESNLKVAYREGYRVKKRERNFQTRV